MIWRPDSRTFALSVLCRATFRLDPVEAVLADEQEPLNDEDSYWNDDLSRSLTTPGDFTPAKPRADVVLVGHAFAARKEPVRSLVVRLKVGEIDKSIEVFGDRAFSSEGELQEGPRFVRMPLRWERAAGGPESSNPVGMRLDVKDRYGATALPNLQPPAIHVNGRGDHIAPIGFGPISPTWPARRERLARSGAAWPSRWMDVPLPGDVDLGYFNIAPRDQQIAVLRDDERIVLENLHPEHPYLVTSLPGLRPQVRVERPGTAAQDLALTAETLWIDTDRGICTMTWRGTVSLSRPEEPGRVVIAWAQDDARAPTTTARLPPPLAAADGDGGNDVTETIAPFLVAGKGAALPFSRTRPESNESALIEEVSIDEELPDDPRDYPAGGTMLLPGGPKGSSPRALPFVAPAPVAAAPAPTAPLEFKAPLSEVAPPALIRAPVSAAPIAPSIGVSPWTGAGGAPGQGAFATVGAAVVAPALMTDPARRPASAVGVQAASDAAAGGLAAGVEIPVARAAPAIDARPKASAREVVKLLWFDPASVARVRAHVDWRILLAELELRLLDAGDDEDDDGDAASKDRRDVVEVLARGSAVGPEAMKLVLAEAIGERDRFDPPLVLLSGELELPFDEVESLKATATAVRPLSSADKKLKETLDMVDELFKTTWLQGSGGLAEGLTEKVREAYSQGKRMLPLDVLEGHVERMLLEQRCFQRRTVYGKKWIRSVMRGGSGGSGGAGGAVPVYLPEALRDELPMFGRWRAKLIGEVDLREDQGETSSCAVKVVALARVVA
jgi:hypothetical protein